MYGLDVCGVLIAHCSLFSGLIKLLHFVRIHSLIHSLTAATGESFQRAFANIPTHTHKNLILLSNSLDIFRRIEEIFGHYYSCASSCYALLTFFSFIPRNGPCIQFVFDQFTAAVWSIQQIHNGIRIMWYEFTYSCAKQRADADVSEKGETKACGPQWLIWNDSYFENNEPAVTTSTRTANTNTPHTKPWTAHIRYLCIVIFWIKCARKSRNSTFLAESDLNLSKQ